MTQLTSNMEKNAGRVNDIVIGAAATIPFHWELARTYYIEINTSGPASAVVLPSFCQGYTEGYVGRVINSHASQSAIQIATSNFVVPSPGNGILLPARYADIFLVDNSTQDGLWWLDIRTLGPNTIS